MAKYDMGKDAALDRLARIVRGADTADKDLTPNHAGGCYCRRIPADGHQRPREA